MRIGLILCILLTALGLRVALAADQESLPDLRSNADARLFKPVPGKAVIYLLRDRGTVWAREVPVYLDGRAMGSTTPLTYFRWVVEPGKHLVLSDTTPPAVLEIGTEAGGLYYVWQDVNAGLQRAASGLYEVDRTTARAAISGAQMLQSAQ